MIGTDGKIRGARLKVNTANGTSSIHRPLQKMIPFEINDDKSTYASSSGARGGQHVVKSRMRRRAAVEGQNLRRAREIQNK